MREVYVHTGRETNREVHANERIKRSGGQNYQDQKEKNEKNREIEKNRNPPKVMTGRGGTHKNELLKNKISQKQVTVPIEGGEKTGPHKTKGWFTVEQTKTELKNRCTQYHRNRRCPATGRYVSNRQALKVQQSKSSRRRTTAEERGHPKANRKQARTNMVIYPWV